MGDCGPALAALQSGMPELTRRRSPDAPDECWHVFYGDVRAALTCRPAKIRGAGPAGSILAPIRGNATDGTAATFDQARADFE
jgi:hypothetical protein